MDKQEIRKRGTALYEDELQYAIARDDEVDLNSCRSRAALRLGRELDGQDISAVWLGYIEGIARSVERAFEIDLDIGQVRIGGALRTGALRFVPADKCHARDLMEWDALREQKLNDFRAKREHERPIVAEALRRMDEYGGDPTLLSVWPELFEGRDAA